MNFAKKYGQNVTLSSLGSDGDGPGREMIRCEEIDDDEEEEEDEWNALKSMGVTAGR